MDERRSWIELDNALLSVRQQWEILSVGRSSIYYAPRPKVFSDEQLGLLRLVDEISPPIRLSHIRHCEERSNPGNSAPTLGCFVPRNDEINSVCGNRIGRKFSTFCLIYRIEYCQQTIVFFITTLR